jgi:CcmD family protein
MSSVRFMHAAYGVVWIVLGGYVANLSATYLKLKKELASLAEQPRSRN